MNKIKIYLAGAMSGLTFDEMNGWRVKASNILKQIDARIIPQNPCDYYNFELDPTTYTDKEVKEFDLFLVKNCDLILANLGFKNSIGTAIELELASRLWNKPVIAFGADENTHPWIKLSVTKLCTSLEEAIEHIKEFYLPNI